MVRRWVREGACFEPSRVEPPPPPVADERLVGAVGQTCRGKHRRAVESGIGKMAGGQQVQHPRSCPRDLFQQKDASRLQSRREGTDRLPHTVGADETRFRDTA